MKASDDHNVPSATPQGSTLIDCLRCGYDLGDGSAARCPECGRETLESDTQAREARAGVRGPDQLRVPVLIGASILLTGILFLGSGASRTLTSTLLFAAPPLVLLLSGMVISTTAISLMVSRHHRWFAFRAWLTTTPRLAWRNSLAFGLGSLMVLAGAHSAGLLYPRMLTIMLPLPLLLLPALWFRQWRRAFRFQRQRLGICLGHSVELVTFIGAALVALVVPTSLCVLLLFFVLGSR